MAEHDKPQTTTTTTGAAFSDAAIRAFRMRAFFRASGCKRGLRRRYHVSAPRLTGQAIKLVKKGTLP